MEYDEIETCLYCNGELIRMGLLGLRLHLRCRDCGMDHNRTIEEGENGLENA